MERSRSFGDLDYNFASPNIFISEDFKEVAKQKQDRFGTVRPGTYVTLKQVYGARGYDFDKTTEFEEIVLKYYKIGTTIGRVLSREDVYCTILRLDIFGRFVTDVNVWVGFLSRITKEEFLNAEEIMKDKLTQLHEERAQYLGKIQQIRGVCKHLNFSFFLSKKLKSETSQCKICGKILAFKFRLEDGKDYVHIMEEEWYKEAKSREKIDFKGEEIVIKKDSGCFSRKEVQLLMNRGMLTKQEAAVAMFNFGCED